MTRDEQFNWLKASHEKLQETVTQIRIDVEGLKVKAGIWGLLGGAIPVLILIGYLVVKETSL
jgi:hypothetical protein